MRKQHYAETEIYFFFGGYGGSFCGDVLRGYVLSYRDSVSMPSRRSVNSDCGIFPLLAERNENHTATENYLYSGSKMGVLLDSRPAGEQPNGGTSTHDPVLCAAAPDDARPPQVIAKETSTANGQSQKPPVPLEIVDRYIDEPRPLKVAVIGGGIAGILAGILLPIKVPAIELVIYEKNHNFVCKS